MTLPDAPNARSLETIRAELDEIDERIHALVVRRAGLADEVRHAKTDTGAAALRPAREAQMLRRIAGFDSGRMGLAQIWRLWRELIMANARLQFPFTVDTVAARHDLELWDMGRAHFCFETEMQAHDDSLAALANAAAAPARLALLRCDDDRWWRELARPDMEMRIITALPMIAQAKPSPPRAVVIGNVTPAPSGKDISVILLQAPSPGAGGQMLERLRADNAEKLAYAIPAKAGVLIGWSGFDREVPPALTSTVGGEITAAIVGHHAAPVSDGEEQLP
ncbi:MAG: hypothetical protein HKN60_07680 [Rhizobiales bacterium]|nr:hypothetical protein [Hyphomicrobiales bacterium]